MEYGNCHTARMKEALTAWRASTETNTAPGAGQRVSRSKGVEG